MSEIPEVFAIFEQKLAHVLSFNLRQKGQKKAIEELLVYFSGIVERASKAESRIAELEAENNELTERVSMLDVTGVFQKLGEMRTIELVAYLKRRLELAEKEREK